MKKALSLLMAILMLFASMSMGTYAFAQNSPYVDDDGYYHRISNGEYITFDTDYDRVVNELYKHLLNRDQNYTIMFATSDADMAYTDNSAASAALATENVFNKMTHDAFTVDEYTQGRENAGAGDYLFNSISGIEVNPMLYTSALDTPAEGNVRYYPYKFTVTEVEYITEPEWETAVAEFAEDFSSRYLSDGMSEYDKVKTIYDFIVRNTNYDNEVFNGEFSRSSDRYRIAHSAYGALYGTLLKDGETEYNPDSMTIASGEKIIKNYNQGLAVCEGYSKLFYYLCIYNGIRCHIVDGDFIEDSGKESDPHEWNYVYLDDDTGYGYQWFQVDTTYAANKSYKEVDLNNYDYFLRGRGNAYFGTKEHQQPYTDGMASVKEQLYEWDVAENASSYNDYAFKTVRFTENEETSFSAIIKRVTDYGGDIGERTSFIYTDSNVANRIELDVDEHGNKSLYRVDEAGGFIYNGHESVYTAIIPYVIDESLVGDQFTKLIDVGSYSLVIEGSDNSTFVAAFNIDPLNMSNGSNYDVEEFQSSATYRAAELPEPEIVIIDSFGKTLVSKSDFDVEYLNSNGQVVNAPKDLGNYTVNINFKGNYTGTYTHSFVVEKIKLSLVNNDSIYVLPYYPKAIRESFSPSVSGAEDYISTYQAFGVTLTKGVDFTATSDGNLDYGDNVRYMTFTGIDSSKSLTFGGSQYSRKVGYTVETKFDISDTSKFSLSVADTNTVNKHYYTGKAITPTKFDVIDKYLVQGKDYKIVGYENNVNVGDAYVIIQGINGCTGKLKLKFAINPSSSGGSSSGDSGSGSGDNSGKVTKITLYTPSVKKVTGGKKRLTVKWTPVKGSVTGYKVQYSLKKNFKGAKTVTVKGAKKASVTIKKLKSKKRYYVRIKTYYVYSGKTYTTPWCSSKSAKTK